MSHTGVRAREADDAEPERLAKRLKMEGDASVEPCASVPGVEVSPVEAKYEFSAEVLLPASRSLLPCSRKREEGPGGGEFRVSEPDVGISEYIADDVSRIEGIIKQRYVHALDRVEL